jgi:selenoprotein W-related protein
VRFEDLGARIIAPSPNISITYCRLCGWLLRAAWMGQELLSTFAEELGSVTLIPDDTGGVFEVRIGDEVVWSRADEGRFPEIKELKQLVRDKIAPDRDLGHVDAKGPKT